MFYRIKEDIVEHIKHATDHLGLGHIVDLLLGRGNIEKAYQEFDAAGHEKLKELLYGNKEAPFSDEVADAHFTMLHGSKQGASSLVAQCEEFEFALKDQQKLSPNGIVQRYEELADAGFPVAAWRLYQVYQQGLFDQDMNAEKSEKAIKYATIARDFGMVPEEDKQSSYAQERGRLFGNGDIYETNDVVDHFKNTLQSKKPTVQSFREYEAKLKKFGFNREGILQRYEQLAEKQNYPGAAWRLAQIYDQNLLRQGNDAAKVEKYSNQAKAAGLVPEIDRPAFYEWQKTMFFGDPNNPMDDAIVDHLYAIFKGPKVNQENCELYEDALKKDFKLDDNQIVQRYEQMATNGLAGAAWRLYQIYHDGLLGQEKNTPKVMEYGKQARSSGLAVGPSQKGQWGFGRAA